jgi:predicted N-acetyltransferase YhbS
VRANLVDHRLHRRGIGARLMAWIAAAATAVGARHLLALVARGAKRFHRAQGFVPLAPVSVPLAPGITFPALAMRRTFCPCARCGRSRRNAEGLPPRGGPSP